MSGIGNPTIYNPYGWRLAEIADPVTGHEQRRQLREGVLAWEAEELLHGDRHLTIVHGDPDTLEISRLLSTLYDRLRVIVARAPWARMRGTADFVTATVGGPEADDAIGTLTAIADELDPGDWTITTTVCPPGRLAA